MADREEQGKWVALRRAGLGSINFARLLAGFGTIGEAWATPIEQVARARIDPQYLRAFERARERFRPEEEIAVVEGLGARVMTWMDEDYPPLLREIPQSPPVLFVRGPAGPQFRSAVAVVGTRRVTAYGRQACELFCEALAGAGVPIISGLARGVDAIAHRVALRNGVPTAAVLAGGIDQVYPRENAGLAEQIEEHGCLISEYPAGIPARPDYFPRRNRVLSGLAQATLVIEAGRGSGALHTANWAFEQGRDVFAVPGTIFSRQSEGTNQLIRESTAKLVATPEQLLEELNLASAGGQLALPAVTSPGMEEPPAPDLTDEESAVLRRLANGPGHVDQLSRETGQQVGRLSAGLQVMELRGLVRQVAPMTYVSVTTRGAAELDIAALHSRG